MKNKHVTIPLFLRGMNQRIHFCATKKNLPSQFISTSSSISIALFSCAWHYLFLQANMIQLGSSINCFSFAVTADFVHGLRTFASNCKAMMEKASIRPPCFQGVSSVLAQRIGSVKSREDWVWNRMANEKPEFFSRKIEPIRVLEDIYLYFQHLKKCYLLLALTVLTNLCMSKTGGKSYRKIWTWKRNGSSWKNYGNRLQGRVVQSWVKITQG